MRRWSNARWARRRIAELEKALIYTGDSPYYIDEQILRIDPDANGTRRKRIRRIARAYFAWHGLTVIPVTAPSRDARDPFAYVGHEGTQYPLRQFECPFSTYEIAVTLIRDGMDIKQAFECARRLDS